MSSVEYQPSTIAVASILAARGNDETPAANLDELKAILGSSWPQLDTVSLPSPLPAIIAHFSREALLVESAMMSKCRRCFVSGRGMCTPATARWFRRTGRRCTRRGWRPRASLSPRTSGARTPPWAPIMPLAPPRRQPRTTTIRGDGCAHLSASRRSLACCLGQWSPAAFSARLAIFFHFVG